jgi:hypothetical protein
LPKLDHRDQIKTASNLVAGSTPFLPSIAAGVLGNGGGGVTQWIFPSSAYFKSPFRYLIVSKMLATNGNKKAQRCNPQSAKLEPAGFEAGNTRAIAK